MARKMWTESNSANNKTYYIHSTLSIVYVLLRYNMFLVFRVCGVQMWRMGDLTNDFEFK